MADDRAKIARRIAVAQAFTPSAPIDDLALFAGRSDQIGDVISGVVQKGQHVAIYGERGVGKTSLGNILADLFAAPDLPELIAVKVNCGTEDNFETLWHGIFRELHIPSPQSPGPEDIRYALAGLERAAIVIIDELDRLEDPVALTLVADTIKAMSDHAAPSTLVLVGVADSIGDLIGEHESVARALVKVHMPRMSRAELREILNRGCGHAHITITDEAADRITVLSRGLPHFTHLLAVHGGQRAVAEDRSTITLSDVLSSLKTAVAQHVIEGDYMFAIHSAHQDNLYGPVLLACALAPQDQFGYFTPGAIRGPLEVIAGRYIDIPQFARHLNEFLKPERGSVLQRTGSPRKYLYRFRDPIMQTYVILNALARGQIPAGELLAQVTKGEPTPDEPIAPQPLF
ncbi:MAG TPA: ATP-binding protein [Solirubrobacteraceae bacterium]|nr:ATP-binding protein [Solirubrobacteraceae bacterium]